MSKRRTLVAGEVSQYIPDEVDDDAEKRQRRQSGTKITFSLFFNDLFWLISYFWWKSGRFEAPNAGIRNQRINRVQE